MDCRYTDEEIKNILERCSKSDCENCTRDWSYAAQWDCMRHIERLALDLINRQQTEIERLQTYHDDMESAIYQFREDQAKVKFFKSEIRAEAIKEFTDALKARIRDDMFAYPAEEHCERIDCLVKEMVGDKNGSL